MPSGEVDFDLPEYPDDDPYQSGKDPTDSRDQGGVDPAAGGDAAASRAEPYDYGADSMGRIYPRDNMGTA